MAWQRERKAQSRARILECAAQLFTRSGFEAVGIDQVMAAAGLTRGAFYAHFSSKTELYAEAVACAAQRAKQRVAERSHSADWRGIAASYLSAEHRLGAGDNCPLAFLTTDVQQRDPAVRATYTQVFQGFIDNLAERQPSSERPQQLQAAVLMIGGLALARALDDESLSDEVMASCRAAVMELAS